MLPAMIRVTDRITIPDAELSVSFARSGGPGGQNVNKVSSKAVLRWRVVGSTALPPDVRGRLMEAVRSRLTNEGELVIACDETRDQAQNIAIAEARIAALVRAALVPPKKRHKTKPSRGARERRLKEKSVRSGHKAARGRVRDDD
jgi:ribosome-associated protein